MKCRFCGEKDRACLEQHHIVPRRFEGSDSEQNLVTLCSNCHQKIENIYDERFYLQIITKLSSEIKKNSRYECKSCDIICKGEELRACPYCGSKKTIEVDRNKKGKSRHDVLDKFY